MTANLFQLEFHGSLVTPLSFYDPITSLRVDLSPPLAPQTSLPPSFSQLTYSPTRRCSQRSLATVRSTELAIFAGGNSRLNIPRLLPAFVSAFQLLAALPHDKSSPQELEKRWVGRESLDACPTVFGRCSEDVINYKTTPAWESRVLELTSGKGADLIVDVIGGESVSQSLSAIRLGGQVVIIGILGDTSSPPDLLRKIMMKNALVRGVTVGDVVMFRELLRLLELHKIKPKVGKVFEFGKTKEAFECLKKQDFVGKVVIQVAKD